MARARSGGGTRELLGELRWLAAHHGVPAEAAGEVVAVAVRHARSGGDYPALARRLAGTLGEYRAFALARDLHAAQDGGPRPASRREERSWSVPQRERVLGWAVGAGPVVLVVGADGLAGRVVGGAVALAEDVEAAPLASSLATLGAWTLLAGVDDGEQDATAAALAVASAADADLVALLPPLRRRRLVACLGPASWLVAARGAPLP